MYALIGLAFVVGYLAIVFEHPLKMDKTASALLTAVITWTLLVFGADSILPAAQTALAAGQDISHLVPEELSHHLAEVAQILFFLMGAMVMVELIDAHQGFKVVTDRIQTNNRVTLLWVLGFITFFLSSALDNLTTTIVMISLLRKLVADQQDRWFYAGIVVIAANAGGAWSPIGDVTTTMLWIGNQVTTSGIMTQLFIPSIVCLLVPLAVLTFRLKGEFARPVLTEQQMGSPTTAFERNTVFVLGIGGLLFVPVFKTLTHLPPYMGILLGLGVLWAATEILHREKNDEDKHPLSVAGVIRKIDTSSIMFFLGILLAVAALSSAGHLVQVATQFKDYLGNVYAISIAIGLLSAVVDNVPLVAASMKMYPLITPDMVVGADAEWLKHFVQDGTFWEMLAFCAGTGGSCLIIGSASGVAAMGMEKMTFGWYAKNIGFLALLGYLGGTAAYIVQHALF